MIDTSADAKVINKENSFWVDSLVLCILFGVISATYHVIICIDHRSEAGRLVLTLWITLNPYQIRCAGWTMERARRLCISFSLPTMVWCHNGL